MIFEHEFDEIRNMTKIKINSKYQLALAATDAEKWSMFVNECGADTSSTKTRK